MKSLAAAIVIFAGALAFGAGAIAEALNRDRGVPAYALGALLMFLGSILLAALCYRAVWREIAPLWDALQASKPPVPQSRQTDTRVGDAEELS